MLRRRNIRYVLTTPTTCSPPLNDAETALLERAQRTLRELSETGQRYTVIDIAAHAGVSRAWLYAQTGLRDQTVPTVSLCSRCGCHVVNRPGSAGASGISRAINCAYTVT